MASPNLYVRSTDGSDADNGTTWALAKATISGAAAIDSTTDNRIWVSQNQSESTASAITLAFAGTLATPTWVVCASDSAEPPTAVATTAAVTTTGNSNITITGNVYVDGLTLNCGTGANSTVITLSEKQTYRACDLKILGTGSTGKITCGASSDITLNNCGVLFSSSSQGIQTDGVLNINGGSVLSGGTSPSSLFVAHTSNRPCRVIVSGFDMTNLGSSAALAATSSSPDLYVFRNCKLPASWSGVLMASFVAGARVEMYNCDSTDTNYRLWVEDYAGSIKQETTIVRTSGASDGTTSLAWKMVTSANAKYPVTGLQSPEIVQWSDTTGAKTVTVEIVHDSQGAGSGSKFQDDEIWLEVMSLNTSGFPLGAWTRDAKADVLATAANQADSSVTWTTTGLTTPVKQALSVSITTAEKGFIHARVVMAKASKTCYIDPVMTVA